MRPKGKTSKLNWMKVAGPGSVKDIGQSGPVGDRQLKAVAHDQADRRVGFIHTVRLRLRFFYHNKWVVQDLM